MSEEGAALTGEAGGDLLSALFDHAAAGMYAVDGAGLVIACNPWAERVLGYEPGGLTGLDARDVLRPARGEARQTLQHDVVPGRGTNGDQDVLLRADGSPLPVWWAAAPLPRGEHRDPGVVVVFHDTGAERARDERRSDRYAHSEIAREQAEFGLAEATWLSELTLALVSTLEAEEGLARLVRLLVPRLADAAVIDLIVDRGRVRRTAWTHRDPDRVPAAVLEADPPVYDDTSAAALAQVLRGGPTQQLSAPFGAAPARRASGPRPEEADALGLATTAMLTGLEAARALIVPLRLRSSTFGALTLTRGAAGPPFSDADRVLAEEVARRTALGLDNARLHAQQSDIAATLQRALLTDLPLVRAVELAAHYRPAERTAEVGGDWYDAFRLPGGDLALVVGDVTGHDIQAAARMSELRNMLRALAVDRPEEDPGGILERLDRAQAHLELADSATAVLARLHTAEDGGRWLSWSTAGHPPPLLITADGRARYLTEAHAMLIGLRPHVSRPTATTELPPGATLLLYTDGLIESRTQDIDTGLTRLRRYAAAHHTDPLDRLCVDLVGTLGDTRDDITLIAARIPPASSGPEHLGPCETGTARSKPE
ncbi:SpoIIE family protein phosphatase [Streptomyces sp. AK02-01A]|uniref:SpoIIE family protein phosphatase n=1 Tax=Streptomyces sp. AK02-01A TaxID=3028648 RepID=UPI0029A8C131|nr:SpoIIE family protein phosphatase [Streptomyces sp. AK02-01A]MDX3850089.1 SpoIIE family protein phosphatase [Streptomyces sp. AK02-01A]